MAKLGNAFRLAFPRQVPIHGPSGGCATSANAADRPIDRFRPIALPDAVVFTSSRPLGGSGDTGNCRYAWFQPKQTATSRRAEPATEAAEQS